MVGIRHTVRLGRINGTEIGAHWSLLLLWLVLAAGLHPWLAPHTGAPTAWALSLVLSVAFTASVLAHELGHSLTAQRHGVEVPRISLWMMGGLAELGARAPTAKGNVAIAAAGPAASLAIAVACIFASAGSHHRGWTTAAACIGWLAAVNVILGVFNLLPGSPLDGGRILAGLLWWRSGNRPRAELRAAQAGKVLGWLLIVAGVAQLVTVGGGVWSIMLGWFVLTGAGREEINARMELAAAGHTVAEVCQPLGPSVLADVTVHGVRAMGLEGVCRVVGCDEPSVLDPRKLGRAKADATTRELAVPVAGRTVGQHEPLDEALDRMATMGPGPVLVHDDDGELVGFVSLGKLAQLTRPKAA